MENLIQNKMNERCYIDRIKTREDALAKLQELIEISGFDIRFDYEKCKAYIQKNNHKENMKCISNGRAKTFVTKTPFGVLGISFQEIETMMHYGVKMHVLVKEGNNTRVYMFKQGEKWGADEVPYFVYMDFKGGILYYFASNNHSVEFVTSDTQMYAFEEVLKDYNINVIFNIFNRVNFKHITFGAQAIHTGKYDENGSRICKYVPVCELNYIKNGKGLVRKLINVYNANVYEEINKVVFDNVSPTSNIFPRHRVKNCEELNPDTPPKTFQFDDPESLNYCISVLQSREACDAYKTWKNYVKNLPIMEYIMDYYKELIEGVELYQQYQEDNSPVNGNSKKITDARPSLLMQMKNKINHKVLGLPTSKN